MKIIILNYEYPPVGGGAGNASKEIAEQFAESGHQVRVYTSHFGALANTEIIKNVEVIRLDVNRFSIDRCQLSELWKYHKSVLRQGDEIYRYGTDVVLAFFSIPSGYTALRLFQRYRLPYILSLRGADVPGFYAPAHVQLIHSLIIAVHRSIWQQAAAVCTNGVRLKELAQRVTGADFPIRIIPNGVDINTYKPPKTAANRGRLLFAGRLNEQKGLPALFHALSKLRQIDWELELVGDGPQRQQLHHLGNRLEIADRMVWRGWLAKGSLPEVYQRASWFILPSQDEGMSNALLEALASGLPIIASDIPGTPELVVHNDNGYLYQRNQSGELQSYIARALSLDDVNYQQFCRRSREIAMHYSWAESAKAYLKIVDEQVGDGGKNLAEST